MQTLREHHILNQQATGSKGQVHTIHTACLDKSRKLAPGNILTRIGILCRHFRPCPYHKPRRNPNFKHYGSVADPWHFGTDPDSRIRTKRLSRWQKKYFLLFLFAVFMLINF